MIYTPAPKIWHYRFAFFPKKIGGSWIWLEKYAWRQIRVENDGEMMFIEYELSHPTLGEFKGTQYFLDSCTPSSITWEPLLGMEQGTKE